MWRYTFGFSLLPFVAVVAEGFQNRTSMRGAAFFYLMIILIIAPALTAWTIVRWLHLLSPRMTIDQPHRAPLTTVCHGVAASTIFLATTSLAFALASGINVALVTIASAAGSSAVYGWTVFRKRKPGCCIDCGYNLTGSLAFGRCPECGTAFERIDTMTAPMPLDRPTAR